MTGDISLAAQQYFAASQNTTWLRDDGGFALIEGIARFWASKAYLLHHPEHNLNLNLNQNG
jgi:trehalose/maltose hydrolase-like predicted phosphorylase